jgi:hypothetical protein
MRQFLYAGFLLLAPAGALLAQNQHIEITPQIGYRLEGDAQFDDARPGIPGGVHQGEVDEGDVKGLTVSFPVHRHLQIEILARRQDTELTGDSGLFGVPNRLAGLEITHVHAGIATQWGDGQVQPFAAFSLGVAQLKIDLPGADTEDQFSASMGGGVKIYFSDHIGLRLEGRGFWTGLDDNSSNSCRGRNCSCDRFGDCTGWNDSGISQLEGTVGLIFAF